MSLVVVSFKIHAGFSFYPTELFLWDFFSHDNFVANMSIICQLFSDALNKSNKTFLR